jgi:hypothetical protein
MPSLPTYSMLSLLFLPDFRNGGLLKVRLPFLLSFGAQRRSFTVLHEPRLCVGMRPEIGLRRLPLDDVGSEEIERQGAHSGDRKNDRGRPRQPVTRQARHDDAIQAENLQRDSREASHPVESRQR